MRWQKKHLTFRDPQRPWFGMTICSFWEPGCGGGIWSGGGRSSFTFDKLISVNHILHPYNSHIIHPYYAQIHMFFQGLTYNPSHTSKAYIHMFLLALPHYITIKNKTLRIQMLAEKGLQPPNIIVQILLHKAFGAGTVPPSYVSWFLTPSN